MLLLLIYCGCNIIRASSPFLFPGKFGNFGAFVKYKPPEDDVTFHLYHAQDFTREDELFIDDEVSLEESRFDPNLPTKILIHGWTHGKDTPWLIELREVMARTYLWNIVVVDWAPLSHAVYVEARTHTNVVGKQLEKFCMFLSKCANISFGSVHTIGHSMGAQIAAYAGHRIYERTGKRLGRISGLDPAAPLYEWPHIESLDEILDPGDATFVDIIHTNAKYLGVIFPWGHVDYYPNGGQLQPGCGLFWSCSHMKSVEFWTASVVNPYLFKAYSFKSWDEFVLRGGTGDNLEPVPMGIGADSSIPYGSYFLETFDEERAYLNTTTTIFDSFVL